MNRSEVLTTNIINNMLRAFGDRFWLIIFNGDAPKLITDAESGEPAIEYRIDNLSMLVGEPKLTVKSAILHKRPNLRNSYFRIIPYMEGDSVDCMKVPWLGRAANAQGRVGEELLLTQDSAMISGYELAIFLEGRKLFVR